jgi:trans-aconitate 2-methyltransferase
MRELPFVSEFDIIFSNASMHWVKEHEIVLRCIERALVPGGRMVVQMGGRGSAAVVFAAIEKVISNEPYAGYFKDFQAPYAFYGVEDYLPWLHQAGLIPVRVELIPKIMVHQGYEGLSGWIRTTWHPYLERIPKDLQTRFINDIYKLYIADHQPDPRGNILIGVVRLEVEAQKPLK